MLVIRHLELRHEDSTAGAGSSASSPRTARGSTGSPRRLYVADEVWAWPQGRGPATKRCMTGLVKRRDVEAARDLAPPRRSSTPRSAGCAPGRSRNPPTKRTGPSSKSTGDLHWLEWSLPDDADLDDLTAVKQRNPAAVHHRRGPAASARARCRTRRSQQFHCCRWGVGEGSWLPPGAWQAVRRRTRASTDGEDVWVGVDVGGERSATAVAGSTTPCTSAAGSTTATAASSRSSTTSAPSPRRFNVRELVYDPWRFGQAAQELEREGVHRRRVPAARRAHDPRVAPGCTPRSSSSASRCRTTRSSRGTPRTRSRGTPAAAGGSTSRTRAEHRRHHRAGMAVERAEQKPAPVELLGWL